MATIMSVSCRLSSVTVLLVALLTLPIALGRAQEVDSIRSAPVGLSRESTNMGARPPARQGRPVTLDLESARLGEVLREIARQSGIELVYSKTVVPLDRRVSVKVDSVPALVALETALEGLNVAVQPSGRAWLLVPKRRADGAGRIGTIVGRVTDAKTGSEVVGAEVLLEGTRWRTATGEDGRYRLSGVAAGSYTLMVRRIGYARQTRAVTVVDGQDVIVDVALELVPTQLDEVVTTVTGEQRLRELGHVVGRIDADSLVKEAPVSSLSELLTGRVPGLQVFQAQGTVGGQTNLQVRGPNSFLLNNEPIVIIDGVRYTSTQAPRSSSFSGADLEPTSPLNDINLNDIESIEVVKGPSAATLYGTDAANGVLVITTKRGTPGPARWNAYARGTVTEIPTSEFADRYWGWGTVFGVPDNATTSCTLAALAGGWCTQQDSVTLLPNPLNDPALTIFGNAPRWEYGANVAGGRQDLRYYFSGDYEDATGPVQMPSALVDQLQQQRGLSELPDEWREPNAMTKLNLRANVTAVLGEAADLRVNTGYSRGSTRSFVASTSLSFSGNPYSAGIFEATPNAPYGGFTNPAESFLRTSTEQTERFVGSATGQWRPVRWLVTRAAAGLDLINSNRYTLARRGDTPSHLFGCDNGCVTDERVRRVATTAELGATATAHWGGLSWRTSVGAQYVRNLTDALGSEGHDLPPGGTSVGEAASVQSRQSYAETVTLGGYVEETVGLNDRLFLTGALRVDGASTFGRGYDATVYPKVSASWLLSEERFVPRLPGLDELRLRYAYGASGQQPDPTWARAEFQPEQAVRNGQLTSIVRLNAVGNPDLRPQRVREHEFGFDASALSRRLGLEVTWFRRRVVDQLVSQPLPPGLGNTYTNLGLTTQRGFELQLRAQVLDTRPLSWDLTFQHSLHRTRLVDLGGGFEARIREGGKVEGYPLGARFDRPILGYEDANGDGIIADHELQRSETAVYMGESTPPRSQTLTTVLGIFERRLRVSALLERRSGFTQINGLGCREGCRAAVDPSTPLEEQVQVYADLLPQSGDFTRLREVTVAVDVPRRITSALRVRSATLALSARNLALWTDFTGPDPESATVGVFTAASGGEATGIPQGRAWVVRLDIGL